MIPSSRAQKRSLLGLTDIFVLRRSLGWNGCGVKQRMGVVVNFRHLAPGRAGAETWANLERHVPAGLAGENHA